jgi:hypothetical protein
MDGATYNRAQLITDLFAYWNITSIFGTAHHHAAQSHVERGIRSVTEIIRTFVNHSPTKWSKYLQSAVFSLNTSVHQSTGEIPYFLAFGRLPVFPIDLHFDPTAHATSRTSEFLQNIHDAVLRSQLRTLLAQEERRDLHNATRIARTISIGSYVVLSYPPTGEIGQPKKFNALFRGPYRVVRIISDLNYEVEDTKSPYERQTVHIDRIKPLLERPAHLSLSSTNTNVETTKPLPRLLLLSLSLQIQNHYAGPLVTEKFQHVTHLNHHFILIPIVLLLFIIFSFVRSDPTPPTIQVSSGIYLRHAPPDMVLFRDHATILFRVNLGFHHREDHLHHLLISSCAGHEAHYRSLCLLAVPLTRNLQSLNEKLDFIHSAMTNEPALRPLSPPAVPTIPTTTRRTTTTTTTTSAPTPEEQQIAGLVTNLLRGRRETSSYRPKRQIFLAGIAAGFIGTKLFSYFDHTTMDMPTMYKELTKGMDKINLHNIQEATAIYLLKNQTSNQIHSAITEFNRRFAIFRNETTKLARDLHYGEL